MTHALLAVLIFGREDPGLNHHDKRRFSLSKAA